MGKRKQPRRRYVGAFSVPVYRRRGGWHRQPRDVLPCGLEEVADAEGVVLVFTVFVAVEAEAVAEVQAFVDIETYGEVHAEGAVPVTLFPCGARVAEVDGHQGAHVAEEYGAVSAQTGLDANLVGVGVVEFVGVLGGEYIPGEILVEGVFPTDVEFNLCSDAEFSAEAHAIGNVLGLHLHGSACDGGKCNSFLHGFVSFCCGLYELGHGRFPGCAHM